MCCLHACTCNEARKHLLELCAVNNSTNMNGWFQKNPIHFRYMDAPATKLTRMIDFVIMRRDTDVRVYRSACCWTDHYLVKGMLMLDFS